MNSKNKTYNRKHLTMTQRIWIEKDPATVLKEVKRNRFSPKRSEVWKPLPCNRKRECQIRFLCNGLDCTNLCKSCYTPVRECKSCIDICPDYLPKNSLNGGTPFRLFHLTLYHIAKLTLMDTVLQKYNTKVQAEAV